MTPTTVREEFEKWFELTCGLPWGFLAKRREPSGRYMEIPHEDAWQVWQASRELLANREAQPVYQYRMRNPYNGQVTDWETTKPEQVDFILKETIAANVEFRIIAAPPAPAVPESIITAPIEAMLYSPAASYVLGWNACRAAMLAQPVSSGYKLPPHVYRELVNSLRDTAVKFSGTEQLRERLNTALSQFIEPDHPHTRTVAPEGGNG